MNVVEHTQLAEDLWGSVAFDAAKSSLTDAQRAELDRRLALHREDPARGMPLNTIAEKLGIKLDKEDTHATIPLA